MGKRVELVGHRFGITEVVEYVGMNEHRNAMYKIRCLCGETRIVRGSDLTAMAVRRCGVDCKFERPKFYATFSVIEDGSRK